MYVTYICVNTTINRTYTYITFCFMIIFLLEKGFKFVSLDQGKKIIKISGNKLVRFYKAHHLSYCLLFFSLLSHNHLQSHYFFHNSFKKDQVQLHHTLKCHKIRQENTLVSKTLWPTVFHSSQSAGLTFQFIKHINSALLILKR